MKKFDYSEGKIEADIQLKSGEMLRITAVYPTPAEMITLIKRENDREEGFMQKALIDVFGMKKVIDENQITYLQVAQIYSWYFEKLREDIKNVPPGNAGK